MSIFGEIHRPPMTIVTRDSDLKDSIESVRESMIGGPIVCPECQDIGRPGQCPDCNVERVQVPGFLTYDIFDMEDGEVIQATQAAMARVDQRREADMAVLYFWTMKVIEKPAFSDTGAVLTKDPAPLTASDVEVVFDQIKRHPAYKHHVLVTATEDGKVIKMDDGTIEEVS